MKTPNERTLTEIDIEEFGNCKKGRKITEGLELTVKFTDGKDKKWTEDKKQIIMNTLLEAMNDKIYDRHM